MPAVVSVMTGSLSTRLLRLGLLQLVLKSCELSQSICGLAGI